MKAVKGGTVLRGVANVEHNGKTTMVATARIYNELGELVHLARGTFFVLEESHYLIYHGVLLKKTTLIWYNIV